MATGEKLVFDLPHFVTTHNLNDFVFLAIASNPHIDNDSEQSQFALVHPRVERVRVLKSRLELDDRKRAYRHAYNERETTRERMREKVNSVTFKENRKAYSALPRVIEQKRRTSALRRKATSLIQSENPDLFNRALEEALSKMTQPNAHSNGD